MPAYPLRVVADTNVLLDGFVFNDPSARHWRDAAKHGDLLLISDPACFGEFVHVLGRRPFGLDPGALQAAIAACRAVLHWHEAGVTRAPLTIHHRDPDDQKFLDLAYSAQAHVLLSRDKAVLALQRRSLRLGLFRICTPEVFMAMPVGHASPPMTAC